MKHKLEVVCATSFVLAAFLILLGFMVSSGKGIRERELNWNTAAISVEQNRQVLVKQQQEIERLELEVLRLEGIADCFLDHFEDCKTLARKGVDNVTLG